MNQLLGLAVLAWPLVLLVLIVLAFVIAILVARGFAERTGRSKWRWGWIGFLVVYLPIFWDWIPTVAAHQYYCATESGFWMYKTLDQWKKENPGVMETLVANKVSIQRVGDDENHTDTVVRNQRFNSVNQIHRPIALLPVYRSTSEVVDSGNGQVLARYVDYSSGKGRDYLKFWMNVQGCSDGTKNRIAFLSFSEKLANMINSDKRGIK